MYNLELKCHFIQNWLLNSKTFLNNNVQCQYSSKKKFDCEVKKSTILFRMMNNEI